MGLMGGLLHGAGFVLTLRAGQIIGNTISVSIARCSPFVCALWGALLWKELQGSRCKTVCAFLLTLLLCAIAVGLLLLGGLSQTGHLKTFLHSHVSSYVLEWIPFSL